MAACMFCALSTAPGHAAERGKAGLAELSLEQLGSIEVTSVTKRAEPLRDAAASIYVITADDIRRSGVRTLPEALRLAPNLLVARTNANTYAISARGFNNSIGNKLLVLIDGRTVYTPLFSGVFWDQQDVMLEDIDRIEVISGPGATLWGANAVNGVINIMTRSSNDTQGALAVAGGGNLDDEAAFRYGGKLGETGRFRVYGKTTGIQNTTRTNGTSAPDGWRMKQVGFRADWQHAGDGFTFQGDAYNGQSEHGGFILGFELLPIRVSGANLLGRWTRSLAGGSDIRLQAYVDYTDRDDPLFYRPRATIFDLDFQHGIPLGAHHVLWGGGYRAGRDDVDPGSVVTRFIPDSSRLEWMNLFVQDELRLSDSLSLTAGIKLERNDYTGWETLPSLRLAWKAAEQHLLWSAISRAVRAPSRLDRDVRFPAFPPFVLRGGPNFRSEVANVFELGYRAQPTTTLSYSITAFRHDWNRLRSGEAAPGGGVFIDNRIEGFVNGVEAWAVFQPLPGWRLSGGFTALREHLRTEPGSTDVVGVNNPQLANDPDQQWMLRSSHNLTANQELDIIVRHVSTLPQQNVRDYTAFDMRWGWRINSRTEASVTFQNMFDRNHVEFGAPPQSQFGRNVFVKLVWRP